MRFIVSPGIRANHARSKKGAAGTASQASRRAGTRHAGEGETASPWPDPARRSSKPAFRSDMIRRDGLRNGYARRLRESLNARPEPTDADRRPETSRM